jgi:signal transduction histidine kinase
MGPPKKTPTRRAWINIPNIGFGLALAVLVAIAALSYSNTLNVAEASEGRRKSAVKLDQLQEFMGVAVDIETGERGYVITGDPLFLQPYHEGMEQLFPQLRRLRVTLADDLHQQSALEELEKTVANLDRHVRKVVSFKASGDSSSAQSEVASGHGKQTMDQIRQLIAALMASERTQLQQRDQQFQSGFRWSMIIIVSGSLVALLAVGMAALFVNRGLRERSRLNAELRQALAVNTQTLDQLRGTAADLTRSNQELEQFAYVASHDLQEPLRKVSSFAQLLASQYRGKLDGEADEFIGYMVDGARRMQTLIQNLLAFSRLGRKGQVFAPTDTDDVLQQAIVNLQGAIEDSGAVVTSASLPIVLADESQLIQLFQNLIGNAIKFHGAEKPRIDVRAEANGLECTFSVSDNGIGIDPQFAERIFLIFQRLHTREDYPGTGIGLALCKKIVERHGGRIWLEPQPGQGAAFCFTLPLAIEKEPTHEYAKERQHDRNLVGG